MKVVAISSRAGASRLSKNPQAGDTQRVPKPYSRLFAIRLLCSRSIQVHRSMKLNFAANSRCREPLYAKR